MIGITEKLSIKKYNGSVYSDYTAKLYDFTRDSQSITILSTDFLYVGFKKPINIFFAEMEQASSTDTSMSVEYWNGLAWSSVTGLQEETQALTRSGFVQFDRNLKDEDKTTIDGVDQYWYRLSFALDTSAMLIRAINIIYSDDQDLKKEIFHISDFIPTGETSHVLSHVASRDQIIQQLRTDGRFKVDVSQGVLKDLTAFDLLDASQVKIASTYLTLSKIYTNISDQVDDVYFQKSAHYMSLYNKAMQHFWLWIDHDDDGALDNEERTSNMNPMIYRR